MDTYINLFPHLISQFQKNLDAEGKKVSTIQTVQELRKSFTAGKPFGFDVIIEPKSDEGNQIDD